VLNVKLRIKMRDGWRTAEPRHLPRPTASLTEPFFFVHNDFAPVLGEPPLEQPINIGPATGASGRLTFYLNVDPGEAGHTEDFRHGDMEWEIHDSLSEATRLYPIVRTRDQWRVLPSR
jgi:hypothetical protein